MTMKILIISPGRGGLWQTNLTDGLVVARRRHWRSAWRALEEVVRLLDAGHVPCFESAFASLVEAACDQSLGQAAD
jgi:hypothetical protein